MTLIYRGIQYSSNSVLPASASQITGCYRGVKKVMHFPAAVPVEPFFNLKYRGAYYRPHLAANPGSNFAIAI